MNAWNTSDGIPSLLLKTGHTASSPLHHQDGMFLLKMILKNPLLTELAITLEFQRCVCTTLLFIICGS